MDRFEHMLPDEEKGVFRQAIESLNRAKVRYVIGGAFAVYWYSGVWRDTKDLDVFVTPQHVRETMGVLAAAGFVTFVQDERWLAKAIKEPYLVDIVYGMGDWMAAVDDSWIANAKHGTFLQTPVSFIPLEELIWIKSFIAARDRFDGGDINHLIEATQGNLDWPHLLRRFGEHWEVLLAQLILYRYVYPSRRDYIPRWVMDDLVTRLNASLSTPWPGDKLCRGRLLDITDTYDIDIQEHAYIDARQEIWQRRQRPVPGTKV